MGTLEQLLRSIRNCTVCRDKPLYPPPLPHEPRPVLQAGAGASLCIVGQAPGMRVHSSGRPYTDASGIRLRTWLGLDEKTFYDTQRVAIVPMGFCFPGYDRHGGDLPPRRECRELWHDQVLTQLRSVELVILIGQYAQRWHLPKELTRTGVTETVRRWREIYRVTDQRRVVPLPHPSWRNNAWLARNPWFETELLAELRADVLSVLEKAKT
jgi:uracil-DNA glycosylase